MANQLDGEWQTFVAGLEGVFIPERVKTLLEKVRETCIDTTNYGAVNFATPDGVPTNSGEGTPGWEYQAHAHFPPEVIMLGMTYMYAGQIDFGLDLCKKCWGNIASNDMTWDQPNIIRGDPGERLYAGNCYQDMIL